MWHFVVFQERCCDTFIVKFNFYNYLRMTRLRARCVCDKLVVGNTLQSFNTASSLPFDIITGCHQQVHVGSGRSRVVQLVTGSKQSPLHIPMFCILFSKKSGKVHWIVILSLYTRLCSFRECKWAWRRISDINIFVSTVLYHMLCTWAVHAPTKFGRASCIISYRIKCGLSGKLQQKKFKNKNQ